MLSTFTSTIMTYSEDERISVLRQLDVFNTTTHEAMQNLVQLIAEDFGVPVAAVSLVDKEEVFLKAAVGLKKLTWFDRNSSLCSHAIENPQVTVFENATTEPLLRNNPFVHGEPGVSFYAAAPLIVKEGFCIGVVFVADFTERQFSAADRQRLTRYARCVLHELDLIATIQRRTARLQQRELQLKQAFRLASIGSWEYDAETGQATWSDELFELFGLEKTASQDKLIDLYLSLFHPDDLPAIQAILQNPNRVPDSTFVRIIRPDGKQLHIHQLKRNIYNAAGKLVKVIGISQDITERIVYEERLKDSEERFKALVQNSSDMIAVLDETGLIKYISPSSVAISGYAPEELTGRNVFEFLHEDDISVLVDELQKVAQSTNSGEPTLHRFRTKSGAWIWLESKGMNRMQDSHIGGIIINAREVTERILLEERLAIEQQHYQRSITSAVIKAQEAERSQVGRELHDNVNQVLTTVKLYTEMISDGIGDRKELIRKSQQHLQNCIDEIRNISKRLSAPTLGEITLQDSIKELIESINLTNRIEIKFTGKGIAGLHVSPDLHLAIYRILQEQLNNVIKHSGATLVSISLTRKGTQLSMRVKDNGKGFDLSARRTGIGITNMRTRTENLSGQFELASSPGKGCRLRVQFLME
ncbi:MAG TPA: PAS domain S-box protein [Flavisolibacter sp.]|nr:PAS domain S-box protein [Flavisolibacter sp.]